MSNDRDINEIVSQITSDSMLLKLTKHLYQRESVFAAAYKFTDLCTILIKPIGDDEVGIFFEKKPDSKTAIELRELAKMYCNEVLDQQVRLDLEKKHGNLREMLFKQAFMPVNAFNEKADE